MVRRVPLRLCAAVLGVVGCIVTAASGQPDARTVTVGVMIEAAPFSYQAADGHWNGFAVELWHLVADRLNVDYQIQGM